MNITSTPSCQVVSHASPSNASIASFHLASSDSRVLVSTCHTCSQTQFQIEQQLAGRITRRRLYPRCVRQNPTVRLSGSPMSQSRAFEDLDRRFCVGLMLSWRWTPGCNLQSFVTLCGKMCINTAWTMTSHPLLAWCSNKEVSKRDHMAGPLGGSCVVPHSCLNT